MERKGTNFGTCKEKSLLEKVRCMEEYAEASFERIFPWLWGSYSMGSWGIPLCYCCIWLHTRAESKYREQIDLGTETKGKKSVKGIQTFHSLFPSSFSRKVSCPFCGSKNDQTGPKVEKVLIQNCQPFSNFSILLLFSFFHNKGMEF